MKINWPGVGCSLGFLVGVLTDIYIPIHPLIKVMIAICTLLLLLASIFFFVPSFQIRGLSVWTPDDPDD